MTSNQGPGVFSLRGEELVSLRETPYDAEAVLQDLVGRFPQLLTTTGDEPWVLVRREAVVQLGEPGESSGWLDHLFVDAEGVPTLVEIKRASDTRIRREVVAQLLDYAANARHEWGGDKMSDWYAEEARSRGLDPDTHLREAFAAVEDIDDFWERVRTNLQADRLRLVFVADQIPPSLRRIVEYLNRRMTQTEVIAFEVRQYVDETGEHRTLVPSLIGDTEQASATKGRRAAGVWDRDRLLAETRRRHGEAATRVSAALLDWGAEHGWKLVYGNGNQLGSCAFGVGTPTGTMYAFSVWTSGNVEIGFQYMLKYPPFTEATQREAVRNELNSIQGVAIDETRLNLRPSLMLEQLAQPAALTAFKDLMARVQRQAQEAKASRPL